jgi:hypothetical protein
VITTREQSSRVLPHKLDSVYPFNWYPFGIRHTRFRKHFHARIPPSLSSTLYILQLDTDTNVFVILLRSVLAKKFRVHLVTRLFGHCTSVFVFVHEPLLSAVYYWTTTPGEARGLETRWYCEFFANISCCVLTFGTQLLSSSQAYGFLHLAALLHVVAAERPRPLQRILLLAVNASQRRTELRC